MPSISQAWNWVSVMPIKSYPRSRVRVNSRIQVWILGLLLTVGEVACVTQTRGQIDLKEWMMAQEAKSWAHLQKNISPKEPKVEGGPPPLPGIVVAALSRQDPDYYFHWVRDSANVMTTVSK